MSVPPARTISGDPDPGAAIHGRKAALPGRADRADLPLVLHHLVRHAAQWGIDPAQTAVFGQS